VFDANWIEANTGTSGAGIQLNATALVSNNVILESVGAGITLGVDSAASRDGSAVVNNTIVYSALNGVSIEHDYDGVGYTFPDSDVANNIVYGSGSWDVLCTTTAADPFASIAWQSNDVYGGIGGYNVYDPTGVDGNVGQDPHFTDPMGLDFSLAWPSAWCIDQGLDASGYGVTTDLLGQARPLGLGYDLGAIESY
jgi:hypothetical protein